MTTCPNCGGTGNNFSCPNHMTFWGINPLPDSIPFPQHGGITLTPPVNTELFAEIGRLNVLLSKRDKEFRELSVEYQRNLDLQDKLDERDKEIAALKQTSADLCSECGWRFLVPGVGCQGCERARLEQEIERLKGLMPPDERGPGFVGQGSWSVFAEKVVEERDFLRNQIDEYIALIEDLRKKGIIDQHNRPLPLEGHHKDCGHGKDGWSLCTCDELKKVDEERANKQFQLLVEEGQNLRKEFDQKTAGMRGPPQCSKCGDTGLVQVAPNARGVKQCECKKYGPHHPECGRAKPGMRSPCTCLGLYERDARNQRDLDRCFDELVEDDKVTCDHGNTECKRCGVGQPTRDPRQDLKVGDHVRFEIEGIIKERQSAGIFQDEDGSDFEPIQYAVKDSINGMTYYVGYHQIIKVIGKVKE